MLLNALQQFKGLWTRKTLEEDPKRLADLENLRTTPEGNLRIRAGVKKPVPSGGSWDTTISRLIPASTSATSMVVGGHDIISPRPYVAWRTAAGAMGNDLTQQAFYALFTAATTGERLYFISPGGKFSSFTLSIGRANVNLTLAWKYVDTTGTAQTLTGVTEQFTSTGDKTIRFAPPATWGGNVAHGNGFVGYAIYVEITAVGGGPVIPRVGGNRIVGDFPARRELVVATSDVQVGPTSGALVRYGFLAGTSFPYWLGADVSGYDTGNDAPVRMASHDGVLYWTNGIVQKRYTGDVATPSSLGFTKFPSGGTNVIAIGGGVIPAGTYSYAVALGYGPNGAWGKSEPFLLGQVTYGAPSQGTITLDATQLAALTAGTVDVLYWYRSWDLTGANAALYDSIPLYLIAAQSRSNSTGLFPATYVDNNANFPVPLQQMDSRVRTPPTRTRLICFHKNRLLLANSPDHPSRVWPSLPGEYEAFDTLSDSGFQDFTSGAGEEVTGMADFADMAIVWTGRSMYGIAGLETVDDWYPITIHPEIGCVAPGSIVVAHGRLFWLSESGPMMWDGVNPPQNIGWPVRLENCSPLVHGMSRGVGYDNGYELELIPSDRGSTFSNQWPSGLYGNLFTKYFYSLVTGEWSKTTFSNSDKNYMQPICSIRWPHGTDYDGRPAPVYGRHRTGDSVVDLRLFVGEAGVTDDGTTMTCLWEIPYGPWKAELMVPELWELDTLGLGSLATSVNTTNAIGEKPVIVGTPTGDDSDTLTSYISKFSTPGTGCAAINLKCTANVTATTERNAYLYSAFLHGKKTHRKQPG